MGRALACDVSASEMKTMYMEDGETYQSVADRLGVAMITVKRYVSPLLADEEKAIKKRAPRGSYGGTFRVERREAQTADDAPVLTMRERMIERDKQLGIVREPDFGGMKLEQHTYTLRGAIGLYSVDVAGRNVTVYEGDAVSSRIAGAIKADDISILIRELQTLQGLMA